MKSNQTIRVLGILFIVFMFFNFFVMSETINDDLNVTGNVGIGTTTLPPGIRLTVEGPTKINNGSIDVAGWLGSNSESILMYIPDSHRTVIRSKSGTVTQGAGIDLYNEDAPTLTNDLLLWAGPGGDVIINRSNVGIGTTNPAYKLDVQGGRIGANDGSGKAIFGPNIESGNDRIEVVSSTDDYIDCILNDNIVMHLAGNGNVGIGTTTPDYKLEVNGTIHAEKVIVSNVSADFVFEDDYDLRTLDEVESFIDNYGHLPEIPSAKEVEAHGTNLGEMNTRLLQKIEELTLYMIEQNKQITEQGKRIAELEKQLSGNKQVK